MKKFAFVAFVAVLVFMFSAPAMAIDNIFGGYWRTRAYTQMDFSGNDDHDCSTDLSQVDTRTRLYYTAKFSDKFSFVNKFEMDATWGATDGAKTTSGDHTTPGYLNANDTSGYGDIGADGIKVEVKNSYADFTVGPMNFKVGVQYHVFARGFVFADDAAAAVVTYKGDGITVPFTWIKAFEGGMGYNTDYGQDDENNDFDVDYYAIAPSFNLGGVAIKPMVMYVTSKDARHWDATRKISSGWAYGDFDLWFIGVDIDAKLGPAKTWFTGVYETGAANTWHVMPLYDMGDTDFGAYLLAAGASAPVGPVEVHGQIFTASGDDNNDADFDAFWVPAGQSYYWAEIMGLGVFDNQKSAHACGDKISNITAINAGVIFKATPQLTFTGDLWFAKLNEDDSNGETNLGTEVDLKATYKIMDNLSIDVIAAYLFAGDATYKEGSCEQENPYEIGTQLSLSF